MTRGVGARSSILGGLMVLVLAMGAAAQTPGGTSATPASPEFRDPATGKVWTPETVGRDGKPVAPEDRAFDPNAQAVRTVIAEQRVVGRPIGTVPITAGPTVPIVALDRATLGVIPGERWQAVMSLDNNSADPVDPAIECSFTNGSNVVMKTRAVVQQIGAGVRQELTIHGPRSDIFVDRVTCQVASP